MSELKTFAEAADAVLTSMLQLVDLPEFRNEAGIPEEISEGGEADFWWGVGSGFFLARMLIRFMGNRTHFSLEDMELIIDTLQTEATLNRSDG